MGGGWQQVYVIFATLGVSTPVDSMEIYFKYPPHHIIGEVIVIAILGCAVEQELPELLLFSTINADAYSTRLNEIQANVNSVVSWNVSDWTLTP